MNKTTRLKKPQIPELDTLYEFDDLGGRPKYGGVEMTSETDIPSFQEIMDETHSAVVAEATARDDADEALEAEIQELAGQTSEAIETVTEAVNTEASTRGAADNVLQEQIDSIVASSDVKDIVGTKAELDAYDTSTLGDNDIIKVLQDESQNDATTYYRYVEASDSFTLIGSEGPYYTKAQSDAALNLKADKATTYTKTEVDAALDAKQDTLTAGENITIENNVISAAAGVKEILTTDSDFSANLGTFLGNHDQGMYKITNPTSTNVALTPIGAYESSNYQLRIKAQSSVIYVVEKQQNEMSKVVIFGAYGLQGNIVEIAAVTPGTSMPIMVFPRVTGFTDAYPFLNVLSSKDGKALKDMIGNLANLSTIDKTNLVAAINEIVASSSGVTIFYTPGGIGGRGTDIEGPVFFKDVTYQTPATWAEIYAAFMNGKVLICSNMSDDLFYSEVVSGYNQYDNYGISLSAYEDMAGNGCVINGYNDGTTDWYSFYYTQVPTTVQTTGTSQTDVMSQNATTSMIYSNPSLQLGIRLGSGANSGVVTSASQNIAIGKNATATGGNSIAIGNYTGGAGTYAKALGISSIALGGATTTQHSAVAIGNTSSASGLCSVALGAGAKATQQGQLDVSVGINSTNGYNDSAYRLLTGLYDPQSDHDAATKGYVDTAIAAAGGAEEISAADWSDLWQ